MKKISYKGLSVKSRLFQDLMNNMPDVIYFKDKKGKLTLVNEAHARGLGLKPEQVVGKTDFDFFPKDRAMAMKKDDDLVIKTGKPIIDKIERATRPDGIDNYVSTTKIPRFDDKGKVIGLIGITRDITRRMQLERVKDERAELQKKLESLEEINRLKTEFISVVSHELRTPLSIIKEGSMLLFDEVAGAINEQQKNILKRCGDNIERLKRLIEDLLDMSRLEGGRFKLHYSLVNLNYLLKDTSGFFKRQAEDKGVSLVYRLPRKQANLFVDAERVNQVITNLINNAIKFTEDGGRITIELRIFENKVRVGVIDTGVGITKADLPKVFEKFVQVSKDPAKERKGLGLGLSIAKELVQRHAGEIWVESRPGVGSKFYFTLPYFPVTEALEQEVRNKINKFLESGSALYLINLSVLNLKQLKSETGIKQDKLFKDLKAIIVSVLSDSLRPGRQEHKFILSGIQKGRACIILPGIDEAKAKEASELLRDKIRQYFLKVSAGNVFINLGLLHYPLNRPGQEAELPVNLHIKQILVGPNIRRFRRFSYKLELKVSGESGQPYKTQTIDISRGGLCFRSDRSLKTDAKITLIMSGAGLNKEICVKGRVAWISQLGPEEGQEKTKYKIGLEFFGLKSKDRKAISGLIKFAQGRSKE